MATAERIEELEREVERLRRENEELRGENEELRRKNDELRGLLEKALRRIKRQAGPFAKDKPKKNPRRPGRKKGERYGKQGRREPSTTPAHREEHVARLPERCSSCGGEIEHDVTLTQYQEDIVRQIVQRLFHVEVGHCTSCGRRHQGRHPLQTSDAVGAAAVQIGPEAVALAAELKIMGLSHQKMVRVLEAGYGLHLERSTVCRALTRLATKAQPTYKELVLVVRRSAVVWMDETGWRWAGRLAWLFVVATRQVVVYSIRRGRGFAQAAAILGADFAGTLHHDGLAMYYGFLKASHQSCLAHFVRRCKAMIEAAAEHPAQCFAARLLALLLYALEARRRQEREQITLHGMRVIAGQLLNRQVHSLLIEPQDSPDNERLSNHLAHESPYLFTFLRDLSIDATNNYSELLLRFSIVARKTWGGNRTYTGVFVQEILASVLTTYRLQHKDAFPALVALQRSPTRLLLEEIIPTHDDSS